MFGWLFSKKNNYRYLERTYSVDRVGLEKCSAVTEILNYNKEYLVKKYSDSYIEQKIRRDIVLAGYETEFTIPWLSDGVNYHLFWKDEFYRNLNKRGYKIPGYSIEEEEVILPKVYNKFLSNLDIFALFIHTSLPNLFQCILEKGAEGEKGLNAFLISNEVKGDPKDKQWIKPYFKECITPLYYYEFSPEFKDLDNNSGSIKLSVYYHRKNKKFKEFEHVT